jgi:hypothetical protein
MDGMFQLKNAISGVELREIQQVFDRVISRPWFVRDPNYETELASYTIHLFLNGVMEPAVLYELCERAALHRAKALKAA